MLRRFALFLLVLSCCQAAAREALADQYSPYERETIEAALEQLGGSLEADPRGKRIESIEIVTLEVIEKRDPLPGFLNVFHATSRPGIIRKELLFRQGQRYDPVRIDESARNLRDLRQLSLVLIVPLRGSTPDRVRVLVITKDVWSLRLNSAFSIVDAQLTDLLVQPSEENLFGTHTAIGLNFRLRPDVYSLGGIFVDRRVLGSRIEAALSANAILNRQTGDAEGSYGYFFYGQPLYSLRTEWSWGVAVQWRREITRHYIGLEPKRFDAESTAAVEAIPYVWDTDRWVGGYELTRSFGRQDKFDISVGVETDRRAYRPDRALLGASGASARAVQEFLDSEVPVSDTRISPIFQIRSYSSEYVRVLNFNTLGLQEDFRVGHDLAVRVFPASQHVGSSRTLLGLYSAVGYTVAYGDGLARGVASHTAMLSDADRSDAKVTLRAQAVTPRLGFGRLFYDALLINRYQNYLNERSAIGGNSRLRGYPPDSFLLGDDVVGSTFEFRSRPVEILSQQLGAALFYDVGDAFDRFEDMNLKHGVGLGLRMVFPLAERIVMRADWGFPLNPGYQTFPGSLFITFGQAFPLPTVEPPSMTGGFAGAYE